MPSVLLTGGTGFIGSHTCVELIKAGWTPVLLDNLCNSSALVLDRIEAIAGQRPAFVEADLRDRAAVDRTLAEFPVEAVIHFAGLKAVGESVGDPVRYYENNVAATLVLIDAMRRHDVRKIVFSSSATVYGVGATMPLKEDAPTDPVNAYGRSKLFVEHILTDLVASDPAQRALLLRYFNPVGAHPSGLIGENPRGIPNNLMPFVAQVAAGRQPRLQVFGGDYPTSDGTGVRDYIHVVDLAQGHVAALSKLDDAAAPSDMVVNLGTGQGHSVLDVVRSFEAASGKAIPYDIVARRPGDVAVCFADVTRARERLGWKAQRGLDTMCADAWRWQARNPHGFEQPARA
jgi:UDP-glucose 4-epimerase